MLAMVFNPKVEDLNRKAVVNLQTVIMIEDNDIA